MLLSAGLRRLGVVLPEAVESASAANAAWLEDVIEHLLCVLALDRFADYVSDQVPLICNSLSLLCRSHCGINQKAHKLSAHTAKRMAATMCQSLSFWFAAACLVFYGFCGDGSSPASFLRFTSWRNNLPALLVVVQVVVPVRETAAQALGAALQPTSLPTLQRVLELLSSMHRHHEWSVRHGAFTGIKYLLASRPEASGVLLPAALPVLLAGLTDTDDSVQAAAAEALMPMAPLLLTLGDEQVGPVHCRWCSVGCCSTQDFYSWLGLNTWRNKSPASNTP